MPAFIAANYIMTYYSQHNICPMTTRLPAQTDTIMVNRNIHLEQVAEVMGMNIDLLRSLNPMYRRDVVPGATELSPIRLPQSEVGRFIDLQDSICNHRAADFAKRVEVETLHTRKEACYCTQEGNDKASPCSNPQAPPSLTHSPLTSKNITLWMKSRRYEKTQTKNS